LITLMSRIPPRGLAKWMQRGLRKLKISGNITRTSCKR
jgi:hypothetical protein